jgi:hypothetical protein
VSEPTGARVIALREGGQGIEFLGGAYNKLNDAPALGANGAAGFGAFSPGTVPAPPAEVNALPVRPHPAMQSAASATLSASEIIKTLRARLRDVEAGIRERKTLERERDQLRRLITAAKNERKAPVRQLRTAG